MKTKPICACGATSPTTHKPDCRPGDRVRRQAAAEQKAVAIAAGTDRATRYTADRAQRAAAVIATVLRRGRPRQVRIDFK